MNNNTNQPPKIEPLRIEDRFPHMRTVKSAPTLFRLNGCGFGMYGKRDFDPETNTYVKTYCLCLLFIPVLPLKAYRVADAESGWYFIGKEPLSNFARNWTWWTVTAVIALAAFLAVEIHTSSPEYKAKEQLAEASELLNSGETIQAAKTYALLANGNVLLPEAREGLKESLEVALKSNSPKDVETAFQLLKRAPKKIQQTSPLIVDALERGLERINHFKANDPEGALGILDALSELKPESEQLSVIQIELLEHSVTRNPNRTNRIVQLATVYENTEQVGKCKDLLLAHKDKLGSTEGARILGQVSLAEGNYQDAYELLFPYVQERLEHLRLAETNYLNASRAASERAIKFLERGDAEKSFYTKHKAASEEEQGRMVDEFITKYMEEDAGYNRAVDALRSANQIVNVTLELGIVQLNRAQELNDPAERTAELEAAEETFLAIRGFAAESDEYRLFLGQVYYWLGKSEAGKELFDQLLAANNRSDKILLSLANTLRDVGDHHQARELSEEAYRVATDPKDKFAAASFRSLVQKSIEDQIAWLEKADPNETWNQISLNSARGDKALKDGNNEQAAIHLRKAVEGYAKLPKSAGALNNGGLASMRLYQATRDIRDHQRGVALLEEAIAMNPGDSTLLINTAHTLLTSALMEIAGEFIQFEALGEPANLSMLGHFYSDESERAAIFKRLQESATFQKSQLHMEKALLLSPKTAWLYEMQLRLQRGFRTLPELQKLQQRIATAALDHKEAKLELEEVLTGAKDQEHVDSLSKQIERYEGLLLSQKVQQHPLTAEYVSVTLNNLRQNAAIFGRKADPRIILEEALALYTKHPDNATLGNLQSAYFFAAHEELRQANSAYDSMAKQSRRLLAPQYLLLLVLENGGPLGETIKANAHIAKAIELEKVKQEKFPSLHHIADWALFKNIDGNRASVIAATLKTDETSRAIAETEWALGSSSAPAILNRCWTLKMQGETAKANELYQQVIREGLPLPTL